MKMIKLSSLNNRGFTIIELLIATTILSTVLVMISIVIINIGNLYRKGVTQTRVQNNVRNLSDEISKELQLDATKIIPGSQTIGGFDERSYCTGSHRYSFVIGIQLSNPIQHVLWRDDYTATSSCPPLPLNQVTPAGTIGNGVELITPRSRLLAFDITPNSSPYTVTIGVAHGENDLLCDTGTPGDCTSLTPSQKVWNIGIPSSAPSGAVICKGQSGRQFCAASTLTTSVASRR